MIRVVHPEGAEELTVQEDDGAGPFVQHVCYGGLRGQFTWKMCLPPLLSTLYNNVS